MKAKNLLCLAILASLVMGLLPLTRANPSTFYFDPASKTFPPGNIGDTITLTVRIDTPTADLFLWVMDVAWDPAIFTFVSQTEGMAIKTSGATLFIPGDASVPGLLNDITCGSQFGSGVNIPPNPTDLVVLQFRVDGYTDPLTPTQITIPFASWLTSAGVETSPATVPFSFLFPPPPPTGPTAAFTPATGAVFYVGDIITFDASASSGGYDGDDPTPITEYRWDFDGDLIFDTVTGSPTTTFSYGSPGSPVVTLEVYAPGIPPDIDPRYVDTDRETHTINIIPVPIGPGLDVYTERGGIGPGLPSDAFGPQEEVTVYALVTWNNDPVVNKFVGFEVKDNAGNVIATRTAPTDMSGIATFNFRIPWTGLEAETRFGTWRVFGSVDLAEQIATDVVPFLFGYLLDITGLRTTDAAMVTKTTFLKGEILYVEVTLTNIMFISKIATITATVYDDAGVPIGFAMAAGMSVPPGPSNVWNFGITIPYWRFKGVGRVYVNVFTAMPQSGGVPYCPEDSAIFTLG